MRKLFLPLALAIALALGSSACAAHTHTWEERVVRQPTCYEEGVKELTCVCGEKKQEPIAKTAHNLGDGYESDELGHWQACQNEGCDYVTEKVGHTWNEGVETTPATCRSKGVKTLTCTVCDHTVEEDTDMTAHNLGDGYESDELGHWQACQNDGCDYVTEKVGHTWNEGVETTPATCYGNGVKTFECTVCGKTKTEDITATGQHSFAQEWSFDNDSHYHACTTPGCTARSDEHAHNWDGGRETQAATCIPGEKTYECNDCDATKTEEIPPTGQHSFADDWVIDGSTWGGTLSRECTLCGETEDATLATNGVEYQVTVGGGQSAAFVFNVRTNVRLTFQVSELTGDINVQYTNYTGSQDVTEDVALNAEETSFQINAYNRHITYFIVTSESEEPLTFKIKMSTSSR